MSPDGTKMNVSVQSSPGSLTHQEEGVLREKRGPKVCQGGGVGGQGLPAKQLRHLLLVHLAARLISNL